MVTNNSSDYSPTQYNIQTGGASGTLNNVAPSATSGVPVISQGASSQPVFGTAVVAGGGTGITSTTAYAVLTGGTTSTGALQSVASVGTTGQVLTSNGAGALPSFQNAAGAAANRFFAVKSAASTGVTSNTTIVYDSVAINSTFTYNNATGALTIPTSKPYWVSAEVDIYGIGATNTALTFYIVFNGGLVNQTIVNPFISQNANNEMSVYVSCIVNCTAGQVLTTKIVFTGSAINVFGQSAPYVTTLSVMEIP